MKRAIVVLESQEAVNDCLFQAIETLETMQYQCDLLYVEEIENMQYMPLKMNNFISDTNFDTTLMEIAREQEDERFHAIKAYVSKKDKKYTLYHDVNKTSDLILDYMKYYDLTVIYKGEINDCVKDVMKRHFKPILLIGADPLTLFNKALVAYDDSFFAARSVFEYTHAFNRDVTKAIAVMSFTKDLDFMGIDMDLKSKDISEVTCCVGTFDDFVKASQSVDVVVMGSLSHRVIYEKIIGKYGLKLLKSIEKPIFMG